MSGGSFCAVQVSHRPTEAELDVEPLQRFGGQSGEPTRETRLGGFLPANWAGVETDEPSKWASILGLGRETGPTASRPTSNNNKTKLAPSVCCASDRPGWAVAPRLPLAGPGEREKFHLALGRQAIDGSSLAPGHRAGQLIHWLWPTGSFRRPVRALTWLVARDRGTRPGGQWALVA